VTSVIERTELLTTGPAEALAGLLETDCPDLDRVALPLCWHWVYLLDRHRQSVLGADGHPNAGAIPSPPRPGLTRMFAGGRLDVLVPLRCGLPATRRSFVVDMVVKEGRSGQLTFVTARHEIYQLDRLAIIDEQDIVYRAQTGARPAEPRRFDEQSVDENWVRRELTADPALLFRFSALTYNAHRIHYDRDYVRDELGYSGLVVHGPLQAILMAETARHMRTAQFGHFEYRFESPLLDDQGTVVRAGPGSDTTITAYVLDRTSRVTARGRLKPQAQSLPPTLGDC
jgi:3-methylfumaryl-CoA hydratase